MLPGRVIASIAALALGVGVLAIAAPAQAHNYLVSSNPTADTTVTQLPESFSITTNEALLNLAGDLLGTGPELLPLEPRNLQPQSLHQKVMGTQTTLQLKDQSLQRLGVVWQGRGFGRHAIS